MIQNKQAVINLWFASEMLTIPEIPTPNGKDLFYATKYGRLPWEGTKASQASTGKALFYVVYLGEIGKAEAHARMVSAFGAEVDEEEYRQAREFDAECYSAVLFLNEKGEPLEDSDFKPFQVVDHVLGYAQKWVPQLRESKIRELRDGLYEEFQARFATPVDADPVMRALAPASDPSALRLDPGAFDTIRAITRLRTDSASATQSVAFDWDRIDREERYLRHLAPYLFDPWPERILIRRVEVAKKDALRTRNSLGVMPNFYMDDLEWIGKLSLKAKHGALEKILDGSAPSNDTPRSDILTDASHLRELLAAEKMPQARWPSNPEHHLMMGQQAAVNSICELADVEDPGLRAVNGPPGTGKTTLLRDVIANIITKRAFAMAQHDDSSDLFETVESNGIELVLPTKRLGDSGIVVTSNNNSAVENISAELPEAGAVDRTFAGASFMPQSATAILNARKKPDEPVKDAWGAIAASLGNSDNRRAFAKAWHPEAIAGPEGETLLPPLGRDLTDTDGRATFKEAKDHLFSCRRRISAMQLQMAQAAYFPGAPVPAGVKLVNEGLLNQPEALRQLMSFNVNKEIEIARADLFLAALDLHRAALAENYERLRKTLTLCNTMIGQGLRKELGVDAGKQRRLWDLLFLCVPVVSTSLASIKRMFDQFWAGDIPWLLIDEAGQATPASAAGALWRAKRAVIVGDPLQVEPVATFEDKSVSAIAEKLGVGKELSPSGNSVQTMADRAMSVGAYIGTGENKVWGGLPLRAHRRCADPMFSVANEIAYANQMIQANTTGAELKFPLEESCWIDIASPSSDSHVNKPEIDFVRAVRKWLADEVAAKQKIPSVFFVSPFKKVALACGDGNLKIKGVEAGSVHAFQGKEADVVFIVLGSAAGRKGAGSRNWAGQAPNILNVALTRAKKRVYIVGSIADWGGVPNFSVLAKYMKENHQVIGVEEALDRLRKDKRDETVTDPSKGRAVASELGKSAAPAVSEPAITPCARHDKVLSSADYAEHDARQKWRPLSEIWKEMGSVAGFRVVAKNWGDRYSGRQYTLVTEGPANTSTDSFFGSYTTIKDERETRREIRKIFQHDAAKWVTLEEAVSTF